MGILITSICRKYKNEKTTTCTSDKEVKFQSFEGIL